MSSVWLFSFFFFIARSLFRNFHFLMMMMMIKASKKKWSINPNRKVFFIQFARTEIALCSIIFFSFSLFSKKSKPFSRCERRVFHTTAMYSQLISHVCIDQFSSSYLVRASLKWFCCFCWCSSLLLSFWHTHEFQMRAYYFSRLFFSPYLYTIDVYISFEECAREGVYSNSVEQCTLVSVCRLWLHLYGAFGRCMCDMLTVANIAIFFSFTIFFVDRFVVVSSSLCV